ncbi:DUF4190 domain-containing protein [Naasia sp. SYSU D00948]|uniref:DUF4190 domain-containing protein n=1 Tax=Naasia sp. SYSU D00948 TaxID=2817379 RepID=UPI001B3173F4|nr:DUF4190 domain-containing protein [Naasia sp. SYSU D00948]
MSDPHATALATPVTDGPPAAPPRGLGIASLVLGGAGLIAGWAFLGVPCIVAVVLGHLALQREPAGRAYAILGLVLGYLGIALGVFTAVLIGIALTLPFAFLATFPAFTSL